MTNKERYQRTFSVLHTSAECVKEATAMTKTKRFRPAKALALCAVIVLVLGLATVAYAADVGGIQRTVQIWFHGDQTDAVLNVEQGEYTEYSATYVDEEGVTHQIEGGGIAYDFFGRPHPLTEEEIIENLNSPWIEYEEDGSVWVYYLDQKVDITDKFDKDGFCYVQLENNGRPMYMTVKYQEGYATDTNRYPSPRRFRD